VYITCVLRNALRFLIKYITYKKKVFINYEGLLLLLVRCSFLFTSCVLQGPYTFIDI
jgi:hypothetical protein